MISPHHLESNLLDILKQKTEEISEAEEVTLGKPLSEHKAITLAMMEIYGLDREGEAGVFSDGAKDCGVDYFSVNETHADIYQFKSIEELSSQNIDKPLGTKGIQDLARISNLLQDLDGERSKANTEVKNFISLLSRRLQSLKDQKSTEIYYINIVLVTIHRTITDEAQEEIDQVKSVLQYYAENQDILIEINLAVKTFDNLIDEMFRQINEKWSLPSSKSKEVEFHYDDKFIDDKKSLVMYCGVRELVDAYTAVGYQMFNANVRAYLGKNNVNRKIAGSLKTEKGRENFKYLNNGLTIICDGYSKSSSENVVKVRRPEVINGLQTLKTIHDEYLSANAKTKKSIEEQVRVLIRLFPKDKMKFEIEDLVIATNNQNRMAPRNLRSNNHEQVSLETFFAKMNWFYERKDGGFNAFRETAPHWPTLRGTKRTQFGTKTNGRVADNQLVAAAWSSFCGFSNVGRGQKKEHFEINSLYERTFNMSPAGPGYDFNYSRDDVFKSPDTQHELAPASNLLLAFLLLRVAMKAPKKQVIDKHWVALGSEPEKLSEDPDYLSMILPSSAPHLFVEFCGYLFLQVQIEKRAELGRHLLTTSDILPAYEARNFDLFSDLIFDQNKPVRNEEIFRSIYAYWLSLLHEFMSSESTRDDLLTASSKPSFLHHRDFRKRFFKSIETVHAQIEGGRTLTSRWAPCFELSGGVKNVFSRYID